MARHYFTLFVAGDTPGSRQARANLERICAEHLRPDCKITVVDVTIDSEPAEFHRVLAIPTLIKHAPAPARRIIGDLSDKQTVLAALGLAAPTSPSKETSHDPETTRDQAD